MSVDHFRPIKPFSHLEVAYENLYYCCCECNTYKSNKWPTQEQLDAGVCFVDVCEEEWEDHLEIRSDVTSGKTSIGNFTAEQVRLSRRKLTTRNRELRMKEFKIRSELGRVDRMRRRFGSGIDAETARDLNESEQILLADLSAVLSPEPLED
jgi:hypothetical protein